MGTEKESFIELTERIGRKTGGLSVYPFTSSVQGSPEPVAFLMASPYPHILVAFEQCPPSWSVHSTLPFMSEMTSCVC